MHADGLQRFRIGPPPILASSFSLGLLFESCNTVRSVPATLNAIRELVPIGNKMFLFLPLLISWCILAFPFHTLDSIALISFSYVVI